jgi:ABC-2 type transport system permease protein
MTAIAQPNTGSHAFARLAKTEVRLFLRAPVAVIWAALVPVAALIGLSFIPGIKDKQTLLHGISYLDAYLPILMAFSLCMSAVNLLPPSLAAYREKGILRRLSTTPVPPSRLLGAQALIFAGVGLATSVVLYTVGAGLGVAAPRQLVGFLVMILLIAAATLGLGVLIAALAPTTKSANAIAFVVFFPLMFLAGLWIPRNQMPGWLRTISDCSPLGAGVRGLQSAFAGHWPPTAALLVLIAWAAVTGLLATRFFRWE